jgi:hypothetical protein
MFSEIGCLQQKHFIQDVHLEDHSAIVVCNTVEKAIFCFICHPWLFVVWYKCM